MAGIKRGGYGGIDFLKLDNKFSIISNLLLRRRACMSKLIKSCKNRGFIDQMLLTLLLSVHISIEDFTIFGT